MPKFLTLDNVSEIKDYVDSRTQKHYVHNIRLVFTSSSYSGSEYLRGDVAFSFINRRADPYATEYVAADDLARLVGLDNPIPATGIMWDDNSEFFSPVFVEAHTTSGSGSVFFRVSGFSNSGTPHVLGTASVPIYYISPTISDTVYAID